MEPINVEEVFENYKEKLLNEGPEAAEKALVDLDVDVTDLPEELANKIEDFLKSLVTDGETIPPEQAGKNTADDLTPSVEL